MMTADSTLTVRCRNAKKSCQNNVYGAIVRPQPVTEGSIMDSVAGFISEVQALQNSGGDNKVQVVWARFEECDINDANFFVDNIDVNGNQPTLVLILGYTQGIQVWLIPSTGEAQEVMSWKQGHVKTLRILPTPSPRVSHPDDFAHVRPLIAMTDSTCSVIPYSCVNFMSLRSGEQVHNIKFNSEVCEILINKLMIVVSFREKFAVFDACDFSSRFNVTSCFPSSGIYPNPIALSHRWIAFADKKLDVTHRSLGGMEGQSGQSVASWGITVGTKLAYGVSKMCKNIFSSSLNRGATSPTFAGSPPSAFGDMSPPSETDTSHRRGVVTVLDILDTAECHNDVPSGSNDANYVREVHLAEQMRGVVAHFVAHNKSIVDLKFDPSGCLLLSCDSLGHYFNLFRIMPHPSASCYAAVHHIYSLFRGDTPGSVQDIAFSADSRWVAVSTLRGTTHIFPITPYGGPVSVRTHTSSRVVNKFSRFHRSAGFDECINASGRISPSPSLGSSPIGKSYDSGLALTGLTCLPHPTPHVPPFPVPTLIQSVAQLRQPYLQMLTSHTLGNASAVNRKLSGRGSCGGSQGFPDDIPIRMAAVFASSRAKWAGGSQHANNLFTRQNKRKLNDEALFVMANHGVLLEYSFEAVPDQSLSKEKICESSSIDLLISTFGQWSLTKPRDRCELQPPLPIDCPLLLASPCDRSRSMGGESQTDFDDEDNENVWLSQVEIVTHLGPHRRLWMGPQFNFMIQKPTTSDSSGDCQYEALDHMPGRPNRSNPVNMPTSTVGDASGLRGPMCIEAGSVSSLEMSPRYSSSASGGQTRRRHTSSGDAALEFELHEAMCDTHLSSGESSLIDGLTPTISSSFSGSERKCSSHHHLRTFRVQDECCINDEHQNSNIQYSTSVTKNKVTESSTSNVMIVCDVDTDFSARFSVMRSSSTECQKKDDDVIMRQLMAAAAVAAASNEKNANGGELRNQESKKKQALEEEVFSATTAGNYDTAVDCEYLVNDSISLGGSDSSLDQQPSSSNNDRRQNLEGWCFEADDRDVCFLISANDGVGSAATTTSKVALEDVFKFDSEMTNLPQERYHLPQSPSSASLSLSLDDLRDALDDDVSDGTVSTSTFTRNQTTFGNGSSSTSEASSVGNSPNPKKNKAAKSKNKKKRR